MTSEEFATRVEAMLPTLWRIAATELRAEADREDAIQEALLRAWASRGQLREERYLQTWLIRILLNVCKTQRKRQKRAVPVAEVPDRPGPPDEDGALREAFLRLEPRYRQPLLLHYAEGYSVQEVAAMLHLPQGTVKSHLSRGRARLRDALHEEVFGDENR